MVCMFNWRGIKKGGTRSKWDSGGQQQPPKVPLSRTLKPASPQNYSCQEDKQVHLQVFWRFRLEVQFYAFFHLGVSLLLKWR